MAKENQTAVVIDLKHAQENKKSFDCILLETLDAVFSYFGESGRQAIYDQLERQYGLSKHAIPDNVKVFAESLEKLLGFGAVLVEMQITSGLHSKVNSFRFFDRDFSFANYLEGLRSHLLT